MPDECTCHISPPCEFCVNLTEEEYDIYSDGGLSALREFRDNQKHGVADGGES